MLCYYRRTLLGLFAALKEIENNPIDWSKPYELQLCLIRVVKNIERKIQMRKEQIKKIKRNIIEDQRNKIQESIQISLMRKQIEEYKNIIYILKSIGDGVVFVYLDKWDIKPLVCKQSNGFISGKIGFRREMDIFREFYHRGELVFFNDITNCLRYGDITFVKDGMPIIIEVKSSKVFGKRIKRQREGLKKITEYLLTDKVENLYGTFTGLMQREKSHSNDINHVEELNDLIQQAYDSGGGYEKIESGLYYCVLKGSEKPMIELLEKELMTNPFVYFVNQEKYNCQGYLPFASSIKRPEHFYDFYTGKVILIVVVDLQVIKNKIEKCGYLFEFMDGDWPIKVLSPFISSQDFQINISSHFMGRLAFDFLSLEWFTKELIYGADKLSNEKYYE